MISEIITTCWWRCSHNCSCWSAAENYPPILICAVEKGNVTNVLFDCLTVIEDLVLHIVALYLLPLLLFLGRLLVFYGVQYFLVVYLGNPIALLFYYYVVVEVHLNSVSVILYISLFWACYIFLHLSRPMLLLFFFHY